MKISKLLLLVFLAFSVNAFSQSLDWDVILKCYDSTTASHYSRIRSIALDQRGNPYHSTYDIPTMLSSPQQGFSKLNMINGKNIQATSNNPTNGKVFSSHTNDRLYYFDNNTFKRIVYPSTPSTIKYVTNSTAANPYFLIDDYAKNIYIYTHDTIWKYNSGLNLLWTKELNIQDVAVDVSGNVVIAGDSVFKFDSTGVQLWYYPLQVSKVVTDIHDNIYFSDPNGDLATKLTPSGSLIFSGPITLGAQFDVDTLGNIYSLENGVLVHKINSGGTGYLWSQPLPSNFKILSVDEKQNCYLLGYTNAALMCLEYARISSIPAPATVTCSIPSTSFCVGNNVQVNFTATPAINSVVSYAVYLSDSAGSFAGSDAQMLAITNTSPITVTLPANLDPGQHYKIKVTPYFDLAQTVSTPVNNISISVAPTLSFPILFPTLCQNDPPVLLGATPSGGTYTGDGVYGNYFYPDSAYLQFVQFGIIAIDYAFNNICGSFTTSTIITVFAEPPATFNQLPDTICSTGIPITLVPDVNNSMFSGNGVVGSVFYPDSAGFGVDSITCFYTTANGCTDTTTQFIYVDACLGLDQIDTPGYSIYPNPAHSFFTVVLNELYHTVNLNLTDIAGNSVYKTTMSNSAERTICTKNLPKSVYLLTVQTEKAIVTQKIIVAN